LKVPVFEDGPLEAALYWRKQFEELAELKEWTPAQKFTNALLLLSGDAKDKWEDARAEIGGVYATGPRFTNTMNAFIKRCGATHVVNLISLTSGIVYVKFFDIRVLIFMSCIFYILLHFKILSNSLHMSRCCQDDST
jgi:hypothetical protein